MDLTQTAFGEGKLAEEATWQAVVIIPKAKKYYRGIGFVEVMWKVVADILNRQLTASTTFHDFPTDFGRVAEHIPPPSRPNCFIS